MLALVENMHQISEVLYEGVARHDTSRHSNGSNQSLQAGSGLNRLIQLGLGHPKFCRDLIECERFEVTFGCIVDGLA